MTKLEICKLIDNVENDLINSKYIEYSHRDTPNYIFDFNGTMPVFIFNVRLNKDAERSVDFDVMQPSGNIVSFTLPYECCNNSKILPTGRHYSLSIGRFAEITVKEIKNVNNTVKFIVENIDIINDEKMKKIFDDVHENV